MEQKMYHVTIKGETKEYPEGVPYSEIVKDTKVPVMRR